MGGSLFHSKALREERYTGQDGKAHYELIPLNGDSVSISQSSWKEVVEFYEARGVPRSAWPVYDANIDVPTDDLARKVAQLRLLVAQLDINSVTAPYWAAFVHEKLSSGEIVFYTVV
jgi:hypothetical protein